MPLNIDLLQILLHMLNFVILAGGLTLLLYTPVNRFMEARAAHFAAEEEQNRLAAEESARIKAAYEEKLAAAEAEIAETRARAERSIAELSHAYMADAKMKADATLAAAEAEAEERKAHILESAQTEIGELVITAAHKLLAETVTPEQDAALYDEFIRLARDATPGKRTGS